MTTTKSKGCYAHHHMTMAEFGLWDLCRYFAEKSGVLLFDGRRMAERFEGQGKDAVYIVLKRLVRKGWLELIGGKQRMHDGRFAASRFRVLDHSAWAEKHGTLRCLPVENPRLAKAVACRESQTGPVENPRPGLSGNLVSPVENPRHKLIVNQTEKEKLIVRTDVPAPASFSENSVVSTRQRGSPCVPRPVEISRQVTQGTEVRKKSRAEYDAYAAVCQEKGLLIIEDFEQWDPEHPENPGWDIPETDSVNSEHVTNEETQGIIQ